MRETSKLFGHKTLFSNLIYLDQIQKFPNKILLNGPKGIGKKLLVNHLLNYFYSKNNEQFYNLKSKEYNKNNNKYDKFKYNFYNKVQKGFLKLARENKSKYLILDSNKDNLKNIENKIINKIKKIL